MELQEYTTVNGDILIVAIEAVSGCSENYTTIYFYEGSKWTSARVRTTPALEELSQHQVRVFFREFVDDHTEIHAGVRKGTLTLDLTTGTVKQIPRKWLSKTFGECQHEGDITNKTWQDDWCTVNFIYIMRRLLRSFGLNQQQFADLVDVKQPQISEWINGKCLPSYEQLRSIALSLNISADYLLGLDSSLRRK